MPYTETMTWEEYRAAVTAQTDPGTPPHLIGIAYGIASPLMVMYEDGVSVNDAIVKIRYWDACRKADRNA